jgi:hypothetical protein
MELNREALLERVLDIYSPYYDIQRCEEADTPMVAQAAFHEHGTGYILIRKAEMWSADRHEYVYFFSVPHLTLELYERCVEQARQLGMERIHPAPGHMCSYVVAMFFCDSADEDAVKALKKCRIRKSFQFSLHGWMELHTALVELGKDSVAANPAGRNTAKFLKSVLHPKVKHRFLKMKSKGV